MSKSFLECLRPNKINLVLMLSAYAIWYVAGTLIYQPLNAFYFPPAESVEPSPFQLTVITLFSDLAILYLIGAFAYWLVYYFKE